MFKFYHCVDVLFAPCDFRLSPTTLLKMSALGGLYENFAFSKTINVKVVKSISVFLSENERKNLTGV